jgi:hypothetical protein
VPPLPTRLGVPLRCAEAAAQDRHTVTGGSQVSRDNILFFHFLFLLVSRSIHNLLPYFPLAIPPAFPLSPRHFLNILFPSSLSPSVDVCSVWGSSGAPSCTNGRKLSVTVDTEVRPRTRQMSVCSHQGQIEECLLQISGIIPLLCSLSVLSHLTFVPTDLFFLPSLSPPPTPLLRSLSLSFPPTPWAHSGPSACGSCSGPVSRVLLLLHACRHGLPELLLHAGIGQRTEIRGYRSTALGHPSSLQPSA